MNIKQIIEVFASILSALKEAGVSMPHIDIPQNVLQDGKLKSWLADYLRKKLISYFPLENLTKTNFIYTNQDLFLQGVNVLGEFLGVDIKISMDQMKTPIKLGTNQGEICLEVHYEGSSIQEKRIKYNDHLNRMLNRKRKYLCETITPPKYQRQTIAPKEKLTRSQALYGDVFSGTPPFQIDGQMLSNNPHPDYSTTSDVVQRVLSTMEMPPSCMKPLSQQSTSSKKKVMINEPSPTTKASDEPSLFSESTENHYLDLTDSPELNNESSSEESSLDQISKSIEKHVLGFKKEGDGKHLKKQVNPKTPNYISGKPPHQQEGTSSALSTIQEYTSDESSSEDDDFVTVSENQGSTIEAGVDFLSEDNIEHLQKIKDMLKGNRTQMPQFELIEKILEDMTSWLIKVKTLYLDPCRECNSLCGKHCLVKVRSKKPAGRGIKPAKFENYMD
jgi:hypothetical protein